MQSLGRSHHVSPLRFAFLSILVICLFSQYTVWSIALTYYPGFCLCLASLLHLHLPLHLHTVLFNQDRLVVMLHSKQTTPNTVFTFQSKSIVANYFSASFHHAKHHVTTWNDRYVTPYQRGVVLVLYTGCASLPQY